MFEKDQLVWVPKVAIALYSNPNNNIKETRELWDLGIIIDRDDQGNIKVLVNGKMEYTHRNFVKLCARPLE
tara:strand:- start:14656 stop:14868 length:213 start_codon:yes stop_codon:yes gene_type:complete